MGSRGINEEGKNKVKETWVRINKKKDKKGNKGIKRWARK